MIERQFSVKEFNGSELQIRTVLLKNESWQLVVWHFEVLKIVMFGSKADLVGLEGFKRIGIVFSEIITYLLIDLKKNRISTEGIHASRIGDEVWQDESFFIGITAHIQKTDNELN